MSDSAGPASFGRVEEDGTVYVTTADGERAVGQVPDVSTEEALAFFVRRFEALDLEITLLEQRLASGAVSPDDARHSIKTLRSSVSDANAVGDLASLTTRLEAMAPKLAEAAEARKAERAKQHEATREAKEAMVAEAEKLAGGNDWRGGVNRFRQLLEEWKALPRIDRATDDALWHRFSSARTTYTRRRKAQFAQQSAKWTEAKAIKEQIIEEARGLADSTEWGPTSGAFRDLMARWKAAGSAQRDADDKLWAEFRGIQDQFFNARSEAQNAQDAEFGGNLTAKQALLDKAEAEILPVSDPNEGRAAYRSFIEEYNALGKVPRDAMRGLDNRVRAIENAVKQAEAEEWKRTDPEARHRAEETVAMLSAEIEKLQTKIEKAEARSDAKAVKKAQDSIATYTVWLDQAKATLADFTR
ncbi:DUF349 domain-containing protein [Propioniciclava coleopterorum]|uniref:DUF349 domain-containing protein n=1 Tax=Propioniciclava coleopterorum TaxID=2714937 RepID=A0A6G7Y9Y3_9ACTN|nr:DUF349 domain-containing protein [Propioniciclava coleopterorum]QIK73580.1 DUF349 domain-containing protein [Propioniciclava coleopterorum]